MSKHPPQRQSPTPPPFSTSPSLSLTSSPLFDQALAALPLSSPSAEHRHGRSSTDIIGRQLDEDVTGYFDIVGQEGDEAEDNNGGNVPWREFGSIPTGIPLASPEHIPEGMMEGEKAERLDDPLTTTVPPNVKDDLHESQETTSTDRLDNEFQDGEDLILAQAALEFSARPNESAVYHQLQSEPQLSNERTPVMKKRKRSVTPTLFAQTSTSARHQTPNAIDSIPPFKSVPSQWTEGDILQKVEVPARPQPGMASSLPATEDAWRYTEEDAYAASKFGGIGEYMRHKRKKLQIQNRAIAESRGGANYPQIFQGLEIYINGYVRPSLETLREMIMLHGGTYIPYLDRKGMITHIIASNLTPAKFREFSKYKVVLPAWLTDSVEKGQLLDWKAYKLVPKGGGEEQGMRGGMSQFLAGGSRKVTSTSVIARGGILNKGKGEEKAEAVDVSDEELPLVQQTPIVQAMPKKLGENAITEATALPAKTIAETPPVDLISGAENVDVTPPPRLAGTTVQVVQPVTTVNTPTTPSKHLPYLAPVFAGKSPNSIKQIAAPAKGQSVGLTSDPLTFEHAAAMGYAKNAENADAKRLMQRAEWREQHTAANEGFLEGYYQNSRLHHLSSWKAELKLLVAQAQSAAESGEVIHALAPGATAVPVSELSFNNSTLPKAQTKPTTTLIGQGRSNIAANGDSERIIFHVDFDAFFVSCGLASRPDLKGKPVVVCHSQGTQGSVKDDRNQNATDSGKGSTSEIASCSYEARAKGVKNGMSLGQARRLCPDILTMPYEFETYKKFSLVFYTILMAYADELQAVSVDEALIDVTSQVQALADAPPELESSIKERVSEEDRYPLDVHANSGDPTRKYSSHLVSTSTMLVREDKLDTSGLEEVETRSSEQSSDWAKVLAEKIRSDVRLATSCEVSIGIAHNILLARLATRHAKPAGSYHLVPEAVSSFMADLEVGELPNFGYSTQQKIMDKFGTKKCGELLGKPKGVLQAVLGSKTGESLYNFIRGIDRRKLEPHKERKSVSAEVNYGIRFISDVEAEKFLSDLSKEVSKRLKAIDRLGRQLTLKIMTRHPDAPLEAPKFMGHGVCDVVNKSAVLSNGKGGATDDPTHIADTVLGIFRACKFSATELRGVGIQIQKLESKSETLPPVEEGQNRLGFAVRPQQDALKAEVAPPKEPQVVPPSTIISVPSGNEEEVILIDSKDIIPVGNQQIFDNGIPSRKTSEAPRMSKFGKRRTTIASAAVLPPAPNEIDPEVWGFLPLEDQRAYRQAWVNQGLQIPRIFMEQSKASESKSLDQPRVLFPEAQKHTTGKQNQGRSTSVQASREQRSESVFSRIKESPSRRRGKSMTPGREEVVDISGSSTPPAPVGYHDADLLNLGLDLQVFHHLPLDMQHEVYRDASTSRNTRQHLTKRGGSVNPMSPRTVGGFKSPHKQTTTVQAREAPRRPKMNGTSDIESIMDMIREWMYRSYQEEPNQTEVKVIRKYLVRCVDPETGGIGGIQDAARVMGYWRRICIRIWPSAGMKPTSDAGSPRRAIQEAWQIAFAEVRREVDELVWTRFGSPLVLP